MPVTISVGGQVGSAPRVLPTMGGNLGPRRVMVFIHGGGNFDVGYEQPMVKEIQDRLGRTIETRAARYADVINSPAGALTAFATTDPTVLARFQTDFQNELVRDATLRAMSSAPTSQLLSAFGAATLPPGLNLLPLIPAVFKNSPGLGNLFDTLQRAFPGIPISDWLGKLGSGKAMGGMDFTAVAKEVGLYLLNERVRGQIQARLKQTLDDAMQHYDDIALVSHSLGSVVAFDVLHDCGDAYDKVSCWVTMGCPLAKIQRLGKRSDLGQIGRGTVRRWFNIYDTTDLIANALGANFPSDSYFLYDIFVDVARDPLPSHDYMTNPETMDILAALMA